MLYSEFFRSLICQGYWIEDSMFEIWIFRIFGKYTVLQPNLSTQQLKDLN